MRVVGIDPGRYGALAHVDLNDRKVLGLVDMPLSVGKSGKTAPDPRAICGLLQDWRPDLIVIEHVQPMGRQNPVSLWTFAEGFGELMAAAKLYAGEERRVTLVRPATWKLRLGLSDDKKASLDMARTLFPAAAPQLARMKDDGRAEALLLTEYHRLHVAVLGEVEVF